MDLGHIGAHCHSCGTLDLLPLKCLYCNHTFCKLHSSIANHACAQSSSSSASSIAGPSQPRTRAERCELDGCELKRMRTYTLAPGLVETAPRSSEESAGEDVKCDACGGAFCLSHRTPLSHSCSPTPIFPTAQQLHTASLINKHFPSPSPSSSSTSAAAPPPQPKPKKKKTSPAIELMKIQQFSTPGRGEVGERKERFHLRVGVDFKGDVVGGAGGEEEETGREGERGVYFKRDTTVAIVLQSIITSRRIPYDSKPDDPSSLIHLIAFGFPPHPHTPQILDRTKRIDQSGLTDGARVWVVKGEGSWNGR